MKVGTNGQTGTAPQPAATPAPAPAPTSGYVARPSFTSGRLSTQQRQWLAQMLPYAERASQATGLTTQLILAQWANETAFGTSYAYTHHFNMAGIGITTMHATGEVAANLTQGVQDYIDAINNPNGYYAHIKTAGAGLTVAKKTQAQAQALAASPWAGGHYTGGAALPLSIITASIGNISGVQPGNPASGTASTSAAAPSAAGATASASIDAVLKSAGLTSLIGWANSLATTLTSKGLSATSISATIQTQLQTQPAFQQRFPGFVTRVKKGYPAMSITEYLSYETKAKSMAQAAGLPTGFMTGTEIGKLVSNDVSITELSTRLTRAYQVAANSPAETQRLLTQYFGVKKGTLAAYFLTPAKATKVLQNQITAAQIGTAGAESGFVLPTPSAHPSARNLTPMYLAQMGVSQATAADTFASLSKLLPLTEQLPGTGTEKTSLTQNDLLNYGFFGTNAQELSNVEQARTAPFQGGGGYAMNQKGVTGAGFANSQGNSGA